MLSFKGALSNKLFIALLTVILTSIVQASPSSPSLDTSSLISVSDASVDSSPESMLTPGAKLIAGDPDKNEFFIVGKDDKASTVATNAQKPEMKPEVMNIAANDVMPEKTETVTKVTDALHHALPNTKKTQAEMLTKIAKAEKKQVKVSAKMPTKRALHTKVASKKSMKSKMVVMKKPARTKIASKKMNAKIKMALNGKTHKKATNHKAIAFGKPHPYQG